MRTWVTREEAEPLLAAIGVPWPECGFDVGRGWLPTVLGCLKEMRRVAPEVKIEQVKAKFCQLVVVRDPQSTPGHKLPELKRLVLAAKGICDNSCENCGQPHWLETPRPYVALCEECRDG